MHAEPLEDDIYENTDTEDGGYDIIDLIEASERYPVVSGLYMMEDRQHLCAVERWDTDYYLQNGCTFEFLTPARIQQWTAQTGSVFMPCAYAGLGFCAFRHGVLEDPRLRYPYFYTPLQSIQSGRADVPVYVDFSSEDVSLFRNLTESGVIPHVMVKTDLRVGHEKTMVI